MRSEVKKLMVATLSMAMLIGAGNTINSKANSDEDEMPAIAYNFEVKANCAASKNPGNIYRRSHKTDNAWSVCMDSSNEKKDSRTSTRFYLGKVTTTGVNQYGSALHTVRERDGIKYYSAYSKVCPGMVCLYARDNEDGTTGKYKITGSWSAQTACAPKNDIDG